MSSSGSVRHYPADAKHVSTQDPNAKKKKNKKTKKKQKKQKKKKQKNNKL
jgi:hypothetical protein